MLIGTFTPNDNANDEFKEFISFTYNKVQEDVFVGFFFNWIFIIIIF